MTENQFCVQENGLAFWISQHKIWLSRVSKRCLRIFVCFQSNYLNLILNSVNTVKPELKLPPAYNDHHFEVQIWNSTI